MPVSAEPTTRSTAPPWREYALLGVLAACWGLTYPLTRIGIDTIPPITFICWRNFVGVACLLPLLWWRAKRLPTDLPTWKVFGIQQMINGTLPFLLITWAQLYVPAALAVVLSSTTPIWAFLLAWGVTRHEPATMSKLAGVMLGLAGAIVIVGADALIGLGGSVLPQLAILMATLSFAVATVNGRHLRQHDPMVLTAGSVLLGGLVLLSFSLIIDRPWTLIPSRASLIALIVMAATGTAIGLLIFYRLINTIGPIATNSSSYLRIPVGVGLSIWLLGETIPPSLGGGLVLVVAGVVAMTVPGEIWQRLRTGIAARRAPPSV